MDDLLVEFIAETRETLAALEGEVVAWEATPSDRARVDAIFRFVHTVKGSCGFLNLPLLERLSHAAEDVLADCRAGRREPDARLVTAVLAIIDRIAQLTDAIESGCALPDDNDALIAALAPAPAPATPSPAMVEPPPVAATMAMALDGGRRGSPRSIRLPVDLLDRMMASVSDMVLARNDLARRLRDDGDDPVIGAAFERLTACIGEMRESITRTRMARIENLFSALPRMARDVAAELGKQVDLEIDGGDVELDREMIEMIRDPLTHIVRNAIDHGIEAPADRVRLGKPASGRLRVSARQSGNQIAIEAVDDGRGVDVDRLLGKAISTGLVTVEKAGQMSAQAKLQLVFAPGLSTVAQVTPISGRGVGMDVVRANVERIGGSVAVESRAGQGVRLCIKVPLTLTIIPALTVSAGGHQFAIPRSAIDELVRINGTSVRLELLGGAQLANIRGRRLPVVRLASFLQLEGLREEERATLVVVKPAGGDLYALSVDAVHDHEELVVKPAAPALIATGVYAGTTLPDNSHPMLLLDPAGIALRAGLLGSPVEREEAAAEPEQPDVVLQTMLLFRDRDQVERALPLGLVQRIDDVPGDAVVQSAGRMRLTRDGRLVPLMSSATLPLVIDRLRVLRLHDGACEIGYAIDEIIDIRDLDPDWEPVPEPGLVAGVRLVDGRPVELIDSHWLFAEAGGDKGAVAQGLCLLQDGDDAWTRQVLAPLLRSAGYRITYPGAPDATQADVVIANDESDEPAVRTDMVPVIRLMLTPDRAGDDCVYRYDRSGLLQVLRRRIVGKGGLT